MTEKIEVNLDTSVLMRHLYWSVLPEEANTDAQFEVDRGCWKYFKEPEVILVAGGKAVSEFENLCERRSELYEDMVQFIVSNQKQVFSYNSYDEDVELDGNDKYHVETGVLYGLADVESPADQASILRRCYQQIGECRDVILSDELDETKERYRDSQLRGELAAELDISHDIDILVDAAYLSHEESIVVLAAVDSDITGPDNGIIVDIVREKLDENVDLVIVDAEAIPPADITSVTP